MLSRFEEEESCFQVPDRKRVPETQRLIGVASEPCPGVDRQRGQEAEAECPIDRFPVIRSLEILIFDAEQFGRATTASCASGEPNEHSEIQGNDPWAFGNAQREAGEVDHRTHEEPDSTCDS